MLIENFLNGLTPIEQRLLNASALGNVRNLYPEEVWRLVEENADQVRYQTSLESSATRTSAQHNTSREIQDLKDMMKRLMAVHSVNPGPKFCEFCNASEHKTDECPTLFAPSEDVNAIGGWNSNRMPPRQNQTKFGLAENGFSWREERNFQRPVHEARGPPAQQSQPYNPPHRRADAQPQREPPKRTVEDSIAQLADMMRQS